MGWDFVTLLYDLWRIHQPLGVSSFICEMGTRLTPTPQVLAHLILTAAS